uniref:Uncharacterized protein n=1 Tax=Anopheles coluzzii TaxID=1518534 RepID=A0A8W7Q2B8_ANOCL
MVRSFASFSCRLINPPAQFSTFGHMDLGRLVEHLLHLGIVLDRHLPPGRIALVQIDQQPLVHLRAPRLSNIFSTLASFLIATFHRAGLRLYRSTSSRLFTFALHGLPFSRSHCSASSRTMFSRCAGLPASYIISTTRDPCTESVSCAYWPSRWRTSFSRDFSPTNRPVTNAFATNEPAGSLSISASRSFGISSSAASRAQALASASTTPVWPVRSRSSMLSSSSAKTISIMSLSVFGNELLELKRIVRAGESSQQILQYRCGLLHPYQVGKLGPSHQLYVKLVQQLVPLFRHGQRFRVVRRLLLGNATEIQHTLPYHVPGRRFPHKLLQIVDQILGHPLHVLATRLPMLVRVLFLQAVLVARPNASIAPFRRATHFLLFCILFFPLSILLPLMIGLQWRNRSQQRNVQRALQHVGRKLVAAKDAKVLRERFQQPGERFLIGVGEQILHDAAAHLIRGGPYLLALQLAEHIVRYQLPLLGVLFLGHGFEYRDQIVVLGLLQLGPAAEAFPLAEAFRTVQHPVEEEIKKALPVAPPEMVYK